MFTIRPSTKSGRMPKSSSSCVQRLTRALALSASSMTAVAVAAPEPLTTTTAILCKKTPTAHTDGELSSDSLAGIFDYFDFLCYTFGA